MTDKRMTYEEWLAQVPEGCTPADAMLLRTANHALSKVVDAMQRLYVHREPAISAIARLWADEVKSPGTENNPAAARAIAIGLLAAAEAEYERREGALRKVARDISREFGFEDPKQ